MGVCGDYADPVCIYRVVLDRKMGRKILEEWFGRESSLSKARHPYLYGVYECFVSIISILDISFYWECL